MSHSDPNPNDVLDALKQKIEELIEDDLFDDVAIVVHALDTETNETSLMGNGCIPCASESIIKIIKEFNLKHKE